MAALGLAGAMSLGPASIAQEPGAATPKVMVFTIGGLEARYRVEWDGKAVRYEVSGVHAQGRTPKTVTPTEAQWAAFWAALDEAKVWQWGPNYVNPNVLDGASWTLQLEHGTKRMKSTGRNGYPGDTDVAKMAREPVPSQVFGKTLKAVETLLGFPLE